MAATALLGYPYIYSVPPLKLNYNGWLGNIAIGICYIALIWWCGMPVFGDTYIQVDWVLPLVLSITGIITAIMNDFKSVEGDKAIMRLVSTEFQECTALIEQNMGTQTVPQIAIVSYLHSIRETVYSLAPLSLLLSHLYFQSTLPMEDPLENDLEYVPSKSPHSSG